MRTLKQKQAKLPKITQLDQRGLVQKNLTEEEFKARQCHAGACELKTSHLTDFLKSCLKNSDVNT